MGAAGASLTDDQTKKMESERTAFQTATKDIRQQLNDKRQALQMELAKQTPDGAKCTSLQKEISDLQAQFDMKRLKHILEMKKIDPNFTDNRGMPPGMGHGMGQGMPPGMGPGMGPAVGPGSRPVMGPAGGPAGSPTGGQGTGTGSTPFGVEKTK